LFHAKMLRPFTPNDLMHFPSREPLGLLQLFLLRKRDCSASRKSTVALGGWLVYIYFKS
jgi:hypothetical protein